MLANVRALCFALWTFTLAVPLFIIMMVQAPFVLLTDKFRWALMLPACMHAAAGGGVPVCVRAGARSSRMPAKGCEGGEG